MGCDIHSRAEIRLNGKWQMLGDIFPDTSSTRWFQPTREYLENASDGVLLYTIMQHTNDVTDNDLCEKINEFRDKLETCIKDARDDDNFRKSISRDETGEYDPHGWNRFVEFQKSKFAEVVNLDEQEREKIRVAIRDFRYYTIDEWREEGYDPDDYDTDENNVLIVREHRFPEDDIDWFKNEPLDSRNYTLFAVIANVRNHDGGVEPIAEAKGSSKNPAPPDASPEVVKHQNRYREDGHSHQWLTLAEIEAYDLDGMVTYSGLVPEDIFETMKQNGWPDATGCGPRSWAMRVGSANCFSPEAYEKWVAVNRPRIKPDNDGFVYGPNILPEDVPDEVQPPTAPVDMWMENFEEKPLMYEDCVRLRNSGFQNSRYSYNGMNRIYVHVEWQEKRGDVLGLEFKNMLKVFRDLVKKHGITPDDIRLVCFFDN